MKAQASTNPVLPPDALAAIDKAVGWPQDAIAQAVAIEENQSGGHPEEVGWNYQGHTAADTVGTGPAPPGTSWDSYDVGDFQIDSVHSPGGTGAYQPKWIGQMEDPAANAKAALALFESQGWAPWRGDPSFSGVNLGTGEQAATAVAGETPATLTAELTSKSSSGSGGNVPWWGILAPGAFAITNPGKTASAVGSTAAAALGLGGVGKWIVEGIAALAGVGLIVLALKSAADGGDHEHGHPVRDLAIGAAA